ncbi:RTA1 like protein-domain-containing protein [Lineolata rhizophorae]|uniref:RTA1 like protein-domain-containing protein n=1 Tax=Lineolata rhizophorae TaxID=578093 RepID=A0A6A6NSM1_9PEZI|nr:RTA1 like protein-domain-containing protein [Lineolata rhizophorae]
MTTFVTSVVPTLTSTIRNTMPGSTTTSAQPTCTTATPGKYGHVPADACNAYYSYDPSFVAAVTFAVFFGISTVTHFGQAIWYKKKYLCSVITMAALWETLAFVVRALGSRDQQSLGMVVIATLLLLLAPILINAFVYMTLGRMIYYFLPERRIWRFKASSLAKTFVWLDISAFVVQGAGGNMMSVEDSPSTNDTGRKVYMIGVGIQEFFILIFVTIAARFHIRMNDLERRRQMVRNTPWKFLSWTLYTVLVLITMRILFRLVEFSSGTDLTNDLLRNEWYVLGLDALPMLIAVFLLNLFHPGRSLVGPGSEFPRLSRKEKKALKQQKRASKIRAKERKKTTKAAKRAGISLEDHTSLRESAS